MTGDSLLHHVVRLSRIGAGKVEILEHTNSISVTRDIVARKSQWSREVIAPFAGLAAYQRDDLRHDQTFRRKQPEYRV